jgi:hypothetical protein
MNLNDLFTEEKVRLDPKCWTGKKIGNPKTKMKGGVRVNNCVPAESVNEMDKSQTPPGRDGSNDEGSKKEYTATPTTPVAVTRQGGDILNKAFKDSQRVDPRTGKKMNTKGVAEATGDQKFDSMMGQITGGATARQGVDSLNKSLTARTGSDPETALAKWGQEFINWLEKICRNFERQGVDRFNKLEKVGNLDDGGETMAHWLIEVAKQSNTSGITQADILEFSSKFNTHGMWAWHQFPIAWGLKEWQDYKDQWTGPDGYIANLGQGMTEGLAQDEAEEYGGWRAEFVNEINYNTFEVKLTNTRSKESANFIVRPVDMVSYGPTLSIETMDVHDLQTGQTESWTNDDPAPDGPIAYAISGLFYDDKQLQKKLQNIIDTHDTKGQDMMPGLEKRRSIGQEVDADAYIDSQEKTQAAMAKMKKGVAEKLGDNRPKLGSKRDAGKSVRKWRSARGLDETGVAETMATFSAKASTRNSGSGEFRGVSIPSDMKHPEWREPTWSFQEIAQKLGIPIATLNLLAFNRIGGFPEALSGLSARHGSKKYYKQSEVKRWVNANNVREKLKQGVAEDQLDEKSVSQAQFRTMAAATHNPEFAKKVGISQDVAQEFHSADKHSNYKKLPDRTTEGEQQKGADYRDPPEADYGDDYQDMVARVKKLAGLGPLKTVYDPAKRQYRNMPTAQQPKK